MILRLQTSCDVRRREAFADFCGSYWRPLYVLARGLGQNPHDAEDLVQGFIGELLARDDLGPLSPERGRMRTFLKVAFRHHLVDNIRREKAQRRGGGEVLLSLDTREVERQMAAGESPDLAYDRQWVRTILARSLERLRKKYSGEEKAALFAALEPCLTDAGPSAYAELAEKLGRTETALRAAVHRLREQYREALRAEVADTLGPGEDAEAELRLLMAVR
ncbi:MAG TPA: sigma-70 family RNA polymerase sigma factor [Gemmatimonadales bacterium]|jgi:RNA polymerase sigma-70 factor (ECF subfamily)